MQENFHESMLICADKLKWCSYAILYLIMKLSKCNVFHIS